VRKKNKKTELKSTITTNIAAQVSGTVGATRRGRDQITRVTAPIKVVDTHSRQWNRWSP
jgi:hypothetical protein